MASRLRDVARTAGVSLSTASRVLSGADYPVAPHLRARVEAAARDLDYVPNAQAQALLHGSPGTVGVLAGDVGDPYFSEIVNGIHSVAGRQRLLVTICDTGRDVQRELEYFRMLQAHRTGIVIVAGSELLDEGYRDAMRIRARSFRSGGGQLVAVGSRFLEADRVLVDNVASGRMLGGHLAGLGHRNVGVLAGDLRVASTVDRIEGLRSVLDAAGGRVHVRPGPATRDGGYEGAEEVLRDDPGITAVVGTADQMAAGALVHLRDRGIDVPGDVSVAGFNDIAISRDLVPSLTSVRFPLREMGAAALELAMSQTDTGRVRNLPTELVTRGSTGRSPA